jgi:glycosyltransferase involved in cell wall biosynthesis
MRVLFVNRADAERNLGGDTIQMLKTKDALEARGVTVDVRSTETLDEIPPCDLAHVFNIQFADASWRAFQVLAKHRLPIVLSPIYWELWDFWFEFGVAGRRHWRWLAKYAGKGRARRIYVAWQRGKAPTDRQWRIQRWLLQNAVQVLPNSESEGHLLQRAYQLPAAFQEKITVVHNGIDAAHFQPPPKPNQAFAAEHGVVDFVLEVGTISPTKNQLGLIRALYDLPLPLVFIGQTAEGRPDYGLECEALAAKRGNVTFIERLPHAELPGVFALAAVHALPSWRETPGLASLEAGAAGCRIVTTSIGSTRDYFGDLAWYCYPDDHQSIRAAVEAALRGRPSPALRERILDRYTWDRAAQATLSAYEEVLGRNQPRLQEMARWA